MNLNSFELKEDNHFVAMEYYNLILNRTFLILETSSRLIGLKVNGVISGENKTDELANYIVSPLSVKGNLTNPYSYFKEKYIRRLENEDVLDENFLQRNKMNFVVEKSAIKNAYYNPKKKWGMGAYPHDGRVFIKTTNGKKREFIILGNQSGQEIADRIMIK